MKTDVLAKSTLILACLCAPAASAQDAPEQVEQAHVHALQAQVDALGREFTRLESAPDHVARQQAMRAHWSLMHEHMQAMRRMPGMGARGCGDWMMLDPGASRDSAGRCPMMGHAMPTTKPGPAEPGLTPQAYRQRMHGQMQGMRARMAAIAAQPDPAKRQALVRGHYRMMYRTTQTMRGRGWMWAPATATALPEPASRPAQLVATYCGQCHAAPSPTLHTRQEWTAVTQRMRQHIAGVSNSGVRVPSPSDFEALAAYLSRHARQEP